MHYVVKVKQGKEVMTINTQIVAAIKKGKGIVRGACWRSSGVAGKILFTDMGGGYKGFCLLIIH